MIVHGLLSFVRIRKTNPALFTLRAQAIVQKFYNPRCCSKGLYSTREKKSNAMWTYFAKSNVLRPTFTDKIALLYSSNASSDFTVADIPLVDKTPAFNRDERMLAKFAGGLGIGVLLLTFAAVDAALST